MPSLKQLALRSPVHVGDTFGHWVVTDDTGESREHAHLKTVVYYMCRCKCGLEKMVNGTYLRKGRTKSCRACANKARGKQ